MELHRCNYNRQQREESEGKEMARNMQKKIKEYEKQFYSRKKNPTQKGVFFTGDYEQLVEIAEQDGGTKYDYIDAALKAGFMLGYKLGKQEAKEKTGSK
jgi:membrane-bound lytic murein transglycosylase